MSFKKIFFRILNKYPDSFFKDKTIIDFPAGSGETSLYLADQKKAKVLAFDLFPEFFKPDHLLCTACDITDGIPMSNETADLFISQEGLEHFVDQRMAFVEMNRVLKMGGSLILTTPNGSCLSSRLSWLLTESEKYNRIMPVNEADSLWLNQQNQTSRVYFGHVFLASISRIRFFARISGFEIKKLHFSEFKISNWILFPLLYPWILLSGILTLARNLKKHPEHRSIYWDVFRWTCHPFVLLDPSLVLELKKTRAPNEALKLCTQTGSMEMTT